jgi:hypothetical protein
VKNILNIRDGSAKKSLHLHPHSHFCPRLQAHRLRIAPLSHRVRISHRIRNELFAIFSHISDPFVIFPPLMRQKVVKGAKNMPKKRKSAKCQCNAKNAGGKKKNRSFALFQIAFASHYHPCLIEPTLT